MAADANVTLQQTNDGQSNDFVKIKNTHPYNLGKKKR